MTIVSTYTKKSSQPHDCTTRRARVCESPKGLSWARLAKEHIREAQCTHSIVVRDTHLELAAYCIMRWQKEKFNG